MNPCLFGYYNTTKQKINYNLFGKITGNLSTFVENSQKCQKYEKSRKKLLHFPKKYIKLNSVEVITKTTNKNAP